MKHVWILNHYAVPPGTPGGTRHYSFAKNLPAFGWTASIIAASYEHLAGIQRLHDGCNRSLEVAGDVPFLWLRTRAYSGNGGGRVRNMLEYTARALVPSTTRLLARPDMVIGSSVHPFAAVAGALLAQRFSVPFVFEVRDLWPQTLIDLGRISNRGLAASALRWLEGWLYRRASRIITLLPKASDYIAGFGINHSKVVWIPNGADLSAVPGSGAGTRRCGESFKLMYVGSHGQANDLRTLLHAMKLVEDDLGNRVRLELIGDGPAKRDLQELAIQLGLSNVSFMPPVPKSEVGDRMLEADAFVLTVLNKPELYKYGVSMNKLYDYLAARRPIIFASAAVNDPVRESGAGLTVAPESPEELAHAIQVLANMPQAARDQMGTAGRRYVEEHANFSKLTERLAAVLDQCVAEHARIGSKQT